MVAIRLGLLFSVLVMATGMIWGKAAWGTWWDWEPRLTTFLLVCFLYTAYFVLRSVVEEEQRRATFAAVFAIIAFIDVPITFFATRFLPAGMHPTVITAGGTGMPGSMFVSFFISMIGMTLLLVALIRRDLGVEDLRGRAWPTSSTRSEADPMTIEEGAKFVAAAYAIILAVLVLYYFMSARRVNTLKRDVELLEQEVQRREAPVRAGD